MENKKPSTFELIKLLFISTYHVIAMIVINNWEPFYTTIVKMAIISLILWGIAGLIPHSIPFIKEVSYLGWLTIITIYRLITMKYDDFEYENDEHSDDEGPAQIQVPDEIPESRGNIEPIRNVVNKKEEESDDSTSTRE